MVETKKKEEIKKIGLSEYLEGVKRENALMRVKKAFVGRQVTAQELENEYHKVMSAYKLKSDVKDLEKLKKAIGKENGMGELLEAEAEGFLRELPEVKKMIADKMKTVESKEIFKNVVQHKENEFRKFLENSNAKFDPALREVVCLYAGYIKAKQEGMDINEFLEMIGKSGAFAFDNGDLHPDMLENIDTLKRVDKEEEKAKTENQQDKEDELDEEEKNQKASS